MFIDIDQLRGKPMQELVKIYYVVQETYECQSKITEPYLIIFESSKMDIYLDDISL